MVTLLQNREEAFAAYELARNHMIDQWKSTLFHLRKKTKYGLIPEI